jgi:hypothetical protein
MYENKALEEMIKVKKVKKWKDMAQMMEDIYKLPGRPGKQCR